MKKELFNIITIAFFEPDKELVERRLYGYVAQQLRDTLPKLAGFADEMDRYAYAAAQSDGPELLLDYTRLFLNPGGALVSPYLTSWKKELGEDITERYLAFLDKAQIRTAEDFPDLPEHMLAVLETYYELEETEKKPYFEAFIEPWVPVFTQKLEEKAQTSFYKAFARFLAAWCREEAKNLNS